MKFKSYFKTYHLCLIFILCFFVVLFAFAIVRAAGGPVPLPTGAEYAKPISVWRPSESVNGWFAKLSPSGRYVLSGFSYPLSVSDLQTKKEVNLADKVPNKTELDLTDNRVHCHTGGWIRPETATFTCQKKNDAGNFRYEASTPDWNVVLKESNVGTLIADKGHWAGIDIGKDRTVLFDGQVLTTGAGSIALDGADIVVASKRHPVSRVEYPWVRKLYSWGYFAIVRVLFGLRLTDTQTGLKVFKREVLDAVLPKIRINDFAFDIEILAVARHLGFTRIYESPVQIDWNHLQTNFHGFLFFNPEIRKMLADTLAVFYRLKIAGYYNEK